VNFVMRSERPYLRQATCRHPQVKGVTMVVNSIYNGFRFEDLWLDH